MRESKHVKIIIINHQDNTTIVTRLDALDERLDRLAERTDKLKEAMLLLTEVVEEIITKA